jgi:hypothetical protein
MSLHINKANYLSLRLTWRAYQANYGEQCVLFWAGEQTVLIYPDRVSN